MAEKSIFKCGKKELLELKEILQKYYEHQKKIEEIVKKEEKQLQFNEERKREITQAIIARENDLRNDVSKPFDTTIAKYEAEREELMAQKEEKRRGAIEFYIEQEKDKLNHEGKNYKRGMRKVIDEEGLPIFCMSKVFFALFYPKMVSDAIVLVISLLVILLFLPLGIYYLCFPNGGRLELTTIYLVLIILFFVVYTLINNFIKENHMAAFQKMNALRMDVDRTEKELKDIIQTAKQMSDEELVCETYTLEYLQQMHIEYDQLGREMEAEKVKREAALKEFDEDVIGKEEREKKFRDLYKKEMKRRETLIADIQELKKAEENNMVYINQLLEKYRPLQEMGINIFDENIIDQLLGYIRNREAKTIGDAIDQKKKAVS